MDTPWQDLGGGVWEYKTPFSLRVVRISEGVPRRWRVLFHPTSDPTLTDVTVFEGTGPEVKAWLTSGIGIRQETMGFID